MARFFWSIVCVAAGAMFCLQMSEVLHRYFSYPKKVTVSKTAIVVKQQNTLILMLYPPCWARKGLLSFSLLLELCLDHLLSQFLTKLLLHRPLPIFTKLWGSQIFPKRWSIFLREAPFTFAIISRHKYFLIVMISGMIIFSY